MIALRGQNGYPAKNRGHEYPTAITELPKPQNAKRRQAPSDEPTVKRSRNFSLVRRGGLEPPRPKALDPKSSASASSATLASSRRTRELAASKGPSGSILPARSGEQGSSGRDFALHNLVARTPAVNGETGRSRRFGRGARRGREARGFQGERRSRGVPPAAFSSTRRARETS